MRTRRASQTLIGLAALATLANCKVQKVSESPEQATSLRVGQQVTLYAPSGWQCPVRATPNRKAAQDYLGEDLAGHPSVAQPLAVTVREVHPGPRAVAVQVVDSSGSPSWLSLPRGQVVPCIFDDPKPLTNAMAYVGKQLTFAPWKSSCLSLHASGKAPDAVLVESEPGVTLEATKVVLGPALATATEPASNAEKTAPAMSPAVKERVQKKAEELVARLEAQGQHDAAEKLKIAIEQRMAVNASPAGDTSSAPANEALVDSKVEDVLWVEFGNGLIRVRADSVAGCFVEPGSPEASPPEDVEAWLAPGRCEHDASDRNHVSCTSTLAVWSGTLSSQGIDVTRTWRTLGPVHFYESRPVDGAQFAKTVIDVGVDESSEPRAKQLAGALTGAVNTSVRAASGGSARVAHPDEKDVTYRVRVAVTNVRVGSLAQSQERLSSRYVARTETHENPKKDQLRMEVENAEDGLRRAEDEYQEDKRRFDELKQKAIDECNKQASKAKDEWAKLAGSTACNLGHLVQPSRSSVENAQQQLNDARQAYSQEPSTIEKKIYDDHPYIKTRYSRTASATLRLQMERVGDGEPRVEEIRVEEPWSDFEVKAEPRYEVEGHTPEQGPIRNGDVLLRPLGERMAKLIASKVKQAVVAAQLGEAKRAFLASGAETKAGYEMVDAIAYSVAGKRIERVALRGQASLIPGTPFELPRAAATATGEQCVLAVAVAPEGRENARLAIVSEHQRFADQRGRAAAAVEVCAADHPAAAEAALKLQSPDNGAVRWGLYITRLKPSEPAAEASDEKAESPEAAGTQQGG